MQLQYNTVYNQDFYKYSKYIPDNSVDLVPTDPPYFINYDSTKEWDKGDFIEKTEPWIKEVFRVLKPGGTLWAFMAYQQVFEFVPLLKKYFDVDLSNWLVWARQKGRGSSKHLKSQREDIFYCVKPGGKSTWNNLQMLREVIAPYVKDGRPRGWFLDEFGMRKRWTGLGNFMTYSSPQFNSICEPQLHPAQKPVMLMERLIRLSSKENDVILDPFMGSGTTAIACLLANRKFLGFELEPEYFNITQKRIKDFDYNNYPGYNIDVDKRIVENVNLGLYDKKQLNRIKNAMPEFLFPKS